MTPKPVKSQSEALKSEAKKPAAPKQEAAPGSTEMERGLLKAREGEVVSNKMTKTVIVGVSVRKRHRRYGKFVQSTKRFVAHDEKSECQLGDTVRIVECRPMSKTKRWRVQAIVEKAI